MRFFSVHVFLIFYLQDSARSSSEVRAQATKMTPSDLFNEVTQRVRETALLESTMALLEWDERTGLPKQAGQYRAEQVTFLSGMIHRRKTDPRLGEQLELLANSELASDSAAPVEATIRRLLKDYRRNSRLPIELVEAISRATVLGQQAWEQARETDSWALFRPHLEEIFLLRRREAECLQEEGSLYDALLDHYEEGARSDELTRLFASLRDELVVLVQQIRSSKHPPTGDTWKEPLSIDHQRQTSRWIAQQIGYSFERGRLDETSHPFCTTLGPMDCRILSRYQADYFPSGFYSTLHEAGHGLYEQGLPSQWFGLPPGAYASLGVHESQSRLWENFVGRSEAFWKWCFPEISKQTGHWQGLDAQTVFRDANLVEPSLVRVEADEVTYNLHILIRFEIEQALLAGELAISDAPDAWNRRYEHYLGITPPTHRLGILQDVHWSAGLIGYFPTYTLGNLYAAQLMEAIARDLGPPAEMFLRGEFQPLLDWLRRRVHAHGACFHPVALIESACQQPLDAQPMMKYLRKKLEPVYGL